MTEPTHIPNTLGDYLTADDLAGIPYGSDERIWFGHWPTEAALAFAALKPVEQRYLVLAAAQFAVHARQSVASVTPTLLGLLAQQMSSPR